MERKTKGALRASISCPEPSTSKRQTNGGGRLASWVWRVYFVTMPLTSSMLYLSLGPVCGCWRGVFLASIRDCSPQQRLRSRSRRWSWSCGSWAKSGMPPAIGLPITWMPSGAGAGHEQSMHCMGPALQGGVRAGQGRACLPGRQGVRRWYRGLPQGANHLRGHRIQ